MDIVRVIDTKTIRGAFPSARSGVREWIMKDWTVGRWGANSRGTGQPSAQLAAATVMLIPPTQLRRRAKTLTERDCMVQFMTGSGARSVRGRKCR